MNNERFKKISEEKICEIICDQPDKGKSNYDYKSHISNEFDLLDKYIKWAGSSFKWIRNIVLNEKSTDIYIDEEIKKMSYNLRRAMHKTSDIYSLLKIKGDNTSSNTENIRADEMSIMQEKVRFSIEGEHLHIEFPSLLPRRMQQRIHYTQEDIRRLYKPSFDRYFENMHFIYKKKVVIIFTHFFSNENKFVDYDNFDIKVVMDLITSNVLRDDSPKYCAIFMDYKMGENSHTEVDVIPFDDFEKYLH